MRGNLESEAGHQLLRVYTTFYGCGISLLRGGASWWKLGWLSRDCVPDDATWAQGSTGEKQA
jgi:hypothetical protein